jgi:aminomethyltransferase
MTEETNPYEVGLGKFVDLEQEVDFIGKQALKEVKAAGIKRKLVGLKIHSEPMYQLAQPWPIECDGVQVGEITSAVYSPDLDENIAYALVSIESSDVGKQVVVDMDGELIEATITKIPFIDNREVVWRGMDD